MQGTGIVVQRRSSLLTTRIRHILIGKGLVLPAAHAKSGMVKTPI